MPGISEYEFIIQKKGLVIPKREIKIPEKGRKLLKRHIGVLE